MVFMVYCRFCDGSAKIKAFFNSGPITNFIFFRAFGSIILDLLHLKVIGIVQRISLLVLKANKREETLIVTIFLLHGTQNQQILKGRSPIMTLVKQYVAMK